MADRNDLIKYYKKVAKRANARMMRLEERAIRQPVVLEWAYATAIRDIESIRGKGKTRYASKIPSDITIPQIQARIADVEKFLSMPTSSSRQITAIERKRVNTINERYGTSFTVGDFEKFARDGMLDTMKEGFGSKTMWKGIAKIQANIDDVIKQIEQHKKRHITVLDEKGKPDPILQVKVDEMLQKRIYGKKLIDILR